MSIEKIGGYEPVQPGRGSGRNGRIEEKHSAEGDSVSISKGAREQAEYLRVLDIVKDTPDVRADKVAELKQKLNSSNYINDILIGATADKVMQALGF
ncbi:MAG: flagellar biosynthesis anti-sigma factor FlgM [Spirochaetaceae bacterium]|jgi:negative regulator of flagellin synthesis FlgM|nr:flagellar biosynthesis anti-sigma factor FlgM [Spirochaetaceae bacterium]